MSDEIRIKQATIKDAAVIETLAKQIWTQHYTPIIGEKQVSYMLDKFQSQAAIKSDIDSDYVYAIAYLNDAACGYSADKIDRGVFLSKFYVLQSCRGAGVGKALMDNIVSFTNDHKQPRIWLTCNKFNPSLAVYKKMAFDVIGEVVTDIGGGYVMDDYELEKKL